MAKTSPKVYRSVHIKSDLYGTDPNVKVVIETEACGIELAKLWIPRSSVESIGAMGACKMLPMKAIKARVEREFGFVFNHHSGSLII